jgi:hypothetical protein
MVGSGRVSVEARENYCKVSQLLSTVTVSQLPA